MKKETFTLEEVTKMLLNERSRAVDIAYEFKKKYDKSYLLKKAAKNDLAFIQEELSDTCRIIGNTISGLNGLSSALGVTTETKIHNLLKEYCDEREKLRFEHRGLKLERILDKLKEV